MTLRHKTGCPVFTATPVTRYLKEHKNAVGVVLIILGLLATFFGRVFFPTVMSLLGGLLTFLLLMIAFSMTGMLARIEGTEKGRTSLAILSITVSALLAIFVAYCLAK